MLFSFLFFSVLCLFFFWFLSFFLDFSARLSRDAPLVPGWGGLLPASKKESWWVGQVENIPYIFIRSDKKYRRKR